MTWSSVTKDRFLLTKEGKHFLHRDESGCRSIHLQIPPLVWTCQHCITPTTHRMEQRMSDVNAFLLFLWTVSPISSVNEHFFWLSFFLFLDCWHTHKICCILPIKPWYGIAKDNEWLWQHLVWIIGNASSGILAVVNSLTCPNKHGVLSLSMLAHATVVYERTLWKVRVDKTASLTGLKVLNVSRLSVIILSYLICPWSSYRTNVL